MGDRRLPLAPVVQRAQDDVAVEILGYDLRTDAEWVEVHHYRPGTAAYLTTRYAAPIEDSGLRWQVRLQGVTQQENGEK